MTRFRQIWNPGCYSSLTNPHRDWHKKQFQCPHGLELLLIMDGMPVQRIRFNALSGLSCYVKNVQYFKFSLCFLCIPAIYRCILAYLPIFFNQLSKFLRCESPSTFLGTCLSHHSFIIFLVTNINTLLSGLYLISTGAII